MHSVLLRVWSCFTAKAALEDEATQDHVNEVGTQSSEVGDVATATELPIGLTEPRSPPEDGQPPPPFHAGPRSFPSRSHRIIAAQRKSIPGANYVPQQYNVICN